LLKSVGRSALLIAGVLAASACGWASRADAQSVAAQGLPSRQELNPATRAEPPAPHADRDLFSMAPGGPCPLAQSPLSFTLKSVEFRGAPAAEQAALAGAYKAELGRTIPVGEICAIRDAASRILFHNGILARVEIPEQRIADGALVMEVIEAKVVNVRVRGDAGPVQDLVDSYVGKLRNMTPFDLNKAQRYLLLASDIPGVRVSASIRPSTTSTDRGAVDIDVTVSREAADLVANVQNYGSNAIGPWGGLVRGDLNSFTRFGEQSSLTLYSAFTGDEQRVVQFVETARFGGEGLTGKLSLVDGETKPGGQLAVLGLDGKAFIGEAALSYPLIRARRRNLSLTGGVDWVDESTDITGAGRLSDDHLRIAYARADGDLRPWLGDRFMQLAGSVELRQGVTGLGASGAGDPNLSRFGGRPDAFVARFHGSLDLPLVGALSLHGAVEAQYAGVPLLAYEQMPLGTLTIGRGYDPSVLSGDKGVAGTAELRFGPVRMKSAIQVQPYLFYDAGRVENYGSGQPGGTIASTGIGARLQLANRWNLDLTYAVPLDAPTATIAKPGSKLLVNLTARF
jgi:hemolysin activation/secretion protein